MKRPPVIITPPKGAAVPCLFDSPHSGNDYPADMKASLAHALLRQTEDAFIDELFAPAPAAGAVMIEATFPRAYIDPNRAEDDIDPDLLDGPWPGPINPGPKTKGRAAGLIFGKVHGLHPIYDRILSVAEVQARIETCWRPYHTAMAQALDNLHHQFGRTYHINCHSMPSRGDERSDDGPVDRADFVLGDRDGTTCAGAFTAFVQQTLTDMGYWVAINDPMKGVELVRRYADPHNRRHSLQIEVNRRLYMDETTIEKNDRYAQTAADIERLIQAICAHAAADK